VILFTAPTSDVALEPGWAQEELDHRWAVQEPDAAFRRRPTAASHHGTEQCAEGKHGASGNPPTTTSMGPFVAEPELSRPSRPTGMRYIAMTQVHVSMSRRTALSAYLALPACCSASAAARWRVPRSPATAGSPGADLATGKASVSPAPRLDKLPKPPHLPSAFPGSCLGSQPLGRYLAQRRRRTAMPRERV